MVYVSIFKYDQGLGALGKAPPSSMACAPSLADVRENALLVQGAISQIFDVFGPACLVGGNFLVNFFFLRIMVAMIFRDEFSRGLEKIFRIEFRRKPKSGQKRCFRPLLFFRYQNMKIVTKWPPGGQKIALTT